MNLPLNSHDFGKKNGDFNGKNPSKNGDLSEFQKAQIALAFEKAAVAHIIDKCKKVLAKHGCIALGVVGGASANLRLRAALAQLCAQQGCELLLAPLELCADNALMIARAGVAKYERGDFAPISAPIISPKNAHFSQL